MKQFSARLLSALLVLVMLITLAACGKEPAKDTATDGTTPTTTVTTEATTASTTLDTTTTTVDAEATTAGDTTTATEENTTAPATTTDNIFRPGPGPGDKPTAPTTTTTAPSTTGTKKPATGFIPSVPTTTTTTRPSTTTKVTTTTTTVVTTTTTKPAPKKPIRILAVGNSFSVDAMQNHLFQVLQSLGYDDIVLGNLYVAGCSIDTHWSNVSNGKKSYYYYETNPKNGVWKTLYNVAADRAFGTVEWDVITVQQASPDSGRSGTFGNLGKLVGWLKEKSPNAKILYHMTWAYQKDSTHWAFPAYYGSDQAKMYNDIITTTRDTAAKTAGVQGVIPVGTAIQNLRTSSLGDTVTSDGHHLLDSYGDYTAAVTWACYVSGEDANKVTYRPSEIADHFDEIAQSVNNALKNPYTVTPCN